MLCGFIAWYWPSPLIFLSQFPHLQREGWIIAVSFLTRFLRRSNDTMETNIYGRDYQWSTTTHSPLFPLAITPQAPAKHTAQPETTVPSLCCSWIWPSTPLLANAIQRETVSAVLRPCLWRQLLAILPPFFLPAIGKLDLVVASCLWPQKMVDQQNRRCLGPAQPHNAGLSTTPGPPTNSVFYRRKT